MKKILTILTIFALTCFSVQAGIKERMAKRLPTINKLKSALVIGENNKGYLEVKGQITPMDKKTFEAENTDRRRIYEMLASKTGATLEKVQSRRAEQIASKSKDKIWLQNSDGKWYKK